MKQLELFPFSDHVAKIIVDLNFKDPDVAPLLKVLGRRNGDGFKIAPEVEGEPPIRSVALNAWLDSTTPVGAGPRSFISCSLFAEEEQEDRDFDEAMKKITDSNIIAPTNSFLSSLSKYPRFPAFKA